MFRHNPLRYGTLALLFAGAVYAAFAAGYFGLEILIEILVLAMLVLAIDMVAGFGGMVSLCHGALLGVGAYAYSMLAVKVGVAAPVAMVAAIGITGALAWIIGAVCARTHGIYFIMATLAFGQMAYSYIFETPVFGGDDGLGGIPRLDLSAVGLETMDSRTFALFTLAALVLCYFFAVAVLRSGLGRSLVGVMQSEQRMRALGLVTWRVKADVFGLSGLIAGLAGAISAQHILYISPGLLNWTVSGEALVVVILGGLGTLVGPLVGAAAFVLLKHQVSEVTPYWHLVTGLILIAVVMSRANGIYGFIEDRFAGRLTAKARKSPDATVPAKEAQNA
ncbi:branched-chain amino acid ABC transporter permease [Roseivivax marinus]|uniref:branched-chain amino acid ABC transporter permease n=1 Tax=Roseivivax marinus TaxID=1379903 RepID=UPI00273D7D8B|nr:branched-chain amino acid ABC transporter permease [Roseivivax marinus]